MGPCDRRRGLRTRPLQPITLPVPERPARPSSFRHCRRYVLLACALADVLPDDGTGSAECRNRAVKGAPERPSAVEETSGCRIRLEESSGEEIAVEPWHPFRSAASQQEYLAFYDQRVQRWPIPLESTMVPTTFGDTFVRVQGPADGPPLVLLPGDSETSLSWIPVIEAFAAEHRVYALDHIYDIGRSIYRRQPRRPGDFVCWLDEFFDEFELHDVRLVGHSYGGWMAALYALKFPERLDKLVLLSPPATVLRPPLDSMPVPSSTAQFPVAPSFGDTSTGTHLTVSATTRHERRSTKWSRRTSSPGGATSGASSFCPRCSPMKTGDDWPFRHCISSDTTMSATTLSGQFSDSPAWRPTSRRKPPTVTITSPSHDQTG